MFKFHFFSRSLCALVLALGLSACVGNNDESDNQAQQTQQSQSSAQQGAASGNNDSETIAPNLAEHQQNSNDAVIAACSKLSQADCLKSTSCIVAKKPSGRGYQCRANQDRCEQGFAQAAGKDSCKTADGCFFAPGSCFCPEGVECICGGGHPPMCASEPIVTDADSSEF